MLGIPDRLPAGITAVSLSVADVFTVTTGQDTQNIPCKRFPGSDRPEILCAGTTCTI